MENTLPRTGAPSVWMCGNGVNHGTGQSCNCPAGPAGPGPKLARLLTVLALTVAALLSGGAVATAAPAVDCARQPYGVRGCEAHLGQTVRRDHGNVVPELSDAQLGKVIQRMCFGDPFERVTASMSDPVTRSLALNLRRLDEIKGGYCG